MSELWLKTQELRNLFVFFQVGSGQEHPYFTKKCQRQNSREVLAKLSQCTYTLLLFTLSFEISKIWGLALFYLSSVSLCRWRLSLAVNCSLTRTFCESWRGHFHTIGYLIIRSYTIVCPSLFWSDCGNTGVILLTFNASHLQLIMGRDSIAPKAGEKLRNVPEMMQSRFITEVYALWIRAGV